MPALVAHHRFDMQGAWGPTHLSLQATLAAPWTVLFGPSGSGKSTLLRALAGIDAGAHTLFARHVADSGIWDPLEGLPPERRQVAYAPQSAPLLPHLSAARNICFPETLRRLPPSSSRLSELTALLQLEPLLEKSPRQMSGGERQRVSLARALAVPDARLLLLDEPFAGLDRAFRDRLLPGLRAYLQARDLPVLSVTHDPDEALLLKAEVLRLGNGRLSGQGPVRLILADEIERLRELLRSPPSEQLVSESAVTDGSLGNRENSIQ